jgi:hypothetical protein
MACILAYSEGYTTNKYDINLAINPAITPAITPAVNSAIDPAVNPAIDSVINSGNTSTTAEQPTQPH